MGIVFDLLGIIWVYSKMKDSTHMFMAAFMGNMFFIDIKLWSIFRYTHLDDDDDDDDDDDGIFFYIFHIYFPINLLFMFED